MAATSRRLFFRNILAPLVLAIALAAAPPASALRSGVQPMLDAAKAAMPTDPPGALARARQAEALTLRGPPGDARTAALATAMWLAGEAQLRLDRADAAAPLIQQALRLVRGLRGQEKLEGDLLLSRGALNAGRLNVAAALGDYQRAYERFTVAREKRSQAIALVSIASLYRDGGDTDAALRYYRLAGEVGQTDPLLSISIYNNVGNVMGDVDRLGEAIQQFDRAMVLARQLGNPVLQAQILRNRARVLVLAHRIDAAERTIAVGLALVAREPSAEAWRPQFWSVGAQAALERGELPRAASLIQQIFAEVDPTTSGITFREAHETAFTLFKRLGDSSQALLHLQALKRLDDERAKVAASTNTALMSARFDFKNQELRIAEMKADQLQRSIAFERSRARLQRIIFASLAAATLIVVVLLSFFLITIRRSRNQLARTNVRLEKALAARTEFLASTSHEIRTPLNGILGMTQVMLADRGVAPALRERLEVVHGAGITMRALVDDILDVAKMETGKFTVEPTRVDLCATLSEVGRLWEDQARARGINFTLDVTDCPGWVLADGARVRQIVFNLLSNALKFTESGAVAVKASTSNTVAGSRVRITVTDSGIGIPPDKLAEIFEAFRQVDAGTTRQYGGTGLGLAICRNLARAMGGDVEVSSVLGQGSVFTLDLPFELAPAEREPVAEDAAAGLPRTLVVDRNPITRSMVSAMVTPHAPVITAATLEDALATLAAGGIGRVVADAGVLAADAPDTVGRPLDILLAAARSAGCRLVVIGEPADVPEEDAMTVLPKPITAPALIETLFADAKENYATLRNPPLVSQAA